MELKLTRPLAVFDLEATGGNIASDRIVEIYILKVHPDGKEESFHTRINPRMPIPPHVVEIHGITNEDVKDAPTFLKVAFEIEEFLKDCDLAGYNSNRFDIPMLLEEFYRVGINFDTESRKMVDVFKVFQRMEGRDLASAYKFYCDKELINAHSAEADVRATFDVLKSQLVHYKGELEANVEALHDFTYESQFLDTGRRIIIEGDVPMYNFGKHKGKAVEAVFKQEPQYYDWIMRSEFLNDTKQKLTKLRTAFLEKNKKA